MSGGELMNELARVLDGHHWAALPSLLHEEFACRYVHTGERFDRESWVRFNAEYPGFERFRLRDVVADGDRAVGLAHVTSRVDGVVQEFWAASFLTARDGLIGELTEVWTDVFALPAGRDV